MIKFASSLCFRRCSSKVFQAAAWGIWDGWDGYLTIMGAVMALHLLSAQLQCGCCDGTTLQYSIYHICFCMCFCICIYSGIPICLTFSLLVLIRNIFAFGTRSSWYSFWFCNLVEQFPPHFGLSFWLSLGPGRLNYDDGNDEDGNDDGRVLWISDCVSFLVIHVFFVFYHLPI